MKAGDLEWSGWKRSVSRRLLWGPLCLIYQMPKAGSQTVEATLRPLLPGSEMHRLHSLAPEGIALLQRLAELPSMPEWMRQNFQFQCRLGHALRRALMLRRALKVFFPGIPKVNVIAGGREPVASMLSLFFQIHPFYFPDGIGMDAENCRDLLTLSAAIDPERREGTSLLRQFIGDWYDRELKEIFGIDVLATPFPTQKGYAIYENALARVLVYRFENIDSLGMMLSEFFGINPPEILNRNIGAGKEYAAAYKEVKARLSLPVDFLEKQYSAGFMAHCYAPDERQQLIRQWQRPADLESPARRAEIWLDVGAHYGETSFKHAQAHPETTVYAFEPNLEVGRQRFNRLPNYVVVPMAVCEKNGFAEFFLNANTAVSSLLPFNQDRLKHWIGGEGLAPGKKILVPTIRLDTFMELMGIEAVDFLKIDTQGADFAVIRSAGDRLKAVRKITLEVAITPTQLYQGAGTKAEVIGYLQDRAFTLQTEESQTYGQEENLTFVRSQP